MDRDRPARPDQDEPQTPSDLPVDEGTGPDEADLHQQSAPYPDPEQDEDDRFDAG